MRGCLTAVVAVVMSSACGGAQSEAPPAPVAPRATLQPMRLEALAVAPQLNNGVSVVAADCQQSATETCNGLDENCNGVIDADEIARAPQLLLKLDRDGDGRLTREELRPPRPENPDAQPRPCNPAAR